MEVVDNNEIFSPVVKHCSIRILMSIVNQYSMVLEKLNIKITFFIESWGRLFMCSNLKGLLKEERNLCLLKKSLYGLE